MKSNKLPRKRKKKYIKKNTSIGYISQQVVNEIFFKEEGRPCKFPKLKRNIRNSKGYDIVGYY